MIKYLIYIFVSQVINTFMKAFIKLTIAKFYI